MVTTIKPNTETNIVLILLCEPSYSVNSLTLPADWLAQLHQASNSPFFRRLSLGQSRHLCISLCVAWLLSLQLQMTQPANPEDSWSQWSLLSKVYLPERTPMRIFRSRLTITVPKCCPWARFNPMGISIMMYVGHICKFFTRSLLHRNASESSFQIEMLTCLLHRNMDTNHADLAHPPGCRICCRN